MDSAARFDPHLGAQSFQRTFNASIAARETLVINPTIPFPGTQQVEFQVPATNQVGAFLDVGNGYLSFKYNLDTRMSQMVKVSQPPSNVRCWS